MEPLAEPKEDDDDSGDKDEDDEDSDGEAVVDRKGKGVLRDDKGKGKLIEEEEDEDDDDDDDSDGNVLGSDSDFSDDPLAGVDLNNILPSKTQRRMTQPELPVTQGMLMMIVMTAMLKFYQEIVR